MKILCSLYFKEDYRTSVEYGSRLGVVCYPVRKGGVGQEAVEEVSIAHTCETR